MIQDRQQDLTAIETFDAEGDVNVIIDTPKGSRNKYKYDIKYGVFKLKHQLPAGAVFPFDFGFLPSTLADDGDPVDVLVLNEEATYPGVIVPGRLIGMIEARQSEEGKNETERNDRIVAVAAASAGYGAVRSIEELSAKVVQQIEHFFVSYNQARGRRFEILGRSGPEKAEKAVKRQRREIGADERT